MRRGDAKVVIQILKKTNELLKVVTQPVYSKHILKTENVMPVKWKILLPGKMWKMENMLPGK